MERKWLFVTFMVTFGMILSGCTGYDSETTTYENDGSEVTMNVDSEEKWCPVGASITKTNPQTGQIYTMEIVGKSLINDIEMCHAISELPKSQNGVSKVEYFWSENEENFMMTFYESTGNLVSKIEVFDGTTKITDENGSVTVILEDEKITITDS